jgi:hypothetical protein
MKRSLLPLLTLLAFSSFASLYAQQQPSTQTPVPRLIMFSGSLKDTSGKPATGIVGVTFALYKEEQGGAPLWIETQNVQPDARGHYSILLGSTKSEAFP